LALSNKFLPLMEELLEECTPRRLASTSYRVGEAVALPGGSSDERRVVVRPDGGEFLVPSDSAAFTATDEPGVYVLKSAEGERPFAVNLAGTESQTVPLEVEQLEQFEELRERLGTQATQSEEYERLRQLRDRELESKQKLWKWLVVAALVVVGAETWLAGKRAKRSQDVSGEPA
jgi:hypothetical protein